jgi:hypothetical protein
MAALRALPCRAEIEPNHAINRREKVAADRGLVAIAHRQRFYNLLWAAFRGGLRLFAGIIFIDGIAGDGKHRQ